MPSPAPGGWARGPNPERRFSDEEAASWARGLGTAVILVAVSGARRAWEAPGLGFGPSLELRYGSHGRIPIGAADAACIAPWGRGSQRSVTLGCRAAVQYREVSPQAMTAARHLRSSFDDTAGRRQATVLPQLVDSVTCRGSTRLSQPFPAPTCS